MTRVDEVKNEEPQYTVTSEAPSDAHLPPQYYQPTYDQHYHHQQTAPPPQYAAAPTPPQYAAAPPPPQYAAAPPPQHVRPPHFIPTPVASEGWKTGLFGCSDDPSNALITFCCPCVTFGQIAEILDNGQTSCATSGILYSLILFCIGMPCLITCSYRTKLRARYNLVETPAPDWLTHCFCETCALCQAYRELNLRGMDPAIDNYWNLQRQQQSVMMTPPMQGGMMHR